MYFFSILYFVWVTLRFTLSINGSVLSGGYYYSLGEPQMKNNEISEMRLIDLKKNEWGIKIKEYNLEKKGVSNEDVLYNGKKLSMVIFKCSEKFLKYRNHLRWVGLGGNI